MGGRFDAVELFTSSTGRISRALFLIAVFGLLVVADLYGGLAGGAVHRWTGWIVHPALLYALMCLVAKRLHDRGRSGWWAGLVVAAVVIISPWPDGLIGLMFGLVLFWALIELGLRRGEAGHNRFGPSPLRPVQA